MTPAGGRRVGSASTSRPLRILHLDHTSVVGGAEFALLRMLQADPEWSPYLLLAPSPAADLGVYEALPGRVPRTVFGVRQPAGASTGGTRAAVGVGARVLAQAVATRFSRAFAGADVVDANTARSAAYGALAARWSRKPFVVHLRDLVDPVALGRSGHALMVRVVLPQADGVIANSHTTLESARPHLRAGVPATVIPSASGITRRDTGDAAPALAGDARIRTVGMLARIDPWKGQLLLLEAFARVFRDRDARLQLAGDAPFGHDGHLAELRRTAERLGVAAQVDFLGHVTDVGALLAGWDVAVQASTRPEPLGQNVLQYLAAGRAVVAAGEGGPAEWVTDDVNGLLVPPRDAGALASALERLDTDAALRTRLATAAAATSGLLDDAAVARAHLTFYERVVRAVAGRRRPVVEVRPVIEQGATKSHPSPVIE